MRWIAYSALLILVGCSGKSLVEEREEALSAYQVPIYTHQIPKFELHGFEQEYQKAANSQYPEIAAVARQRIADLALEESEKNLLQYNLDGSGSDQNAGYYKAIAIYTELLKEHPDRALNDTVRYQLARAYDYAGDPLAKLDTLTELVTHHPESLYYSEAQLRRGEQLFSLGRFSQAAEAYRAVTARGESEPFYKHALYKYAWSVYRAGRYSAAYHAFADTLDYLQVPADLEQLRVGDQELVKDVLRIMAISFSQQQGAESIKSFADSRNTPVYTPLFYQVLAQQFATQRLYPQAAEVYLYFADHYVTNPQAPVYHLEAINMYGKGQMPEAQLVSREAFVNRYGVGQSVWQQLPAELLATVKPQIKENLLYLAKHHHALYQRDGDLLELDKAQAWYEALLVGFPNDPDTGENHLLYAESLFEEKQYQQAATAYQHAAYSYPIHERSAEAGYAVLLSLQLDTTLKDDQLASHLIESSAKYLESFPDDKRVAEVRHLKADQHIKLKDYHSAVTELDAVLLAQGAAMTALKGTVLSKLSLSHFILEDFLKAEQNSVMALQYETGTEQRKLLQERHAASIYKQAEQAQQAGDYAAAAEQFLRVGNLVPNASILAQAEYDGATAYISSSNWLAASKVLERFVARFSQHKLHLGAREKLAYVYGELGENTKAANSYGELASLEPDPERKLIWISQSADLHQQAGNFPQAIKMLNRYIEQLADRNMEYYEVMLRIAGIEQSLGKTSAYREKLEQVITLIDKQEPDLGIRQQGANAALTLGRSHHDEFLSIALKPPIKESLSKKNRSMKRAMEFYLQADEYRISDITTASTFYIGEIYSQLSHALLQSPVPAELDVDEKEMYQLMLEEQAFPFEEKSIGLHMVNTERVSKGIYDQWVKKSFKALGELQPGRYNKQETVDTIIAALN